LSIDQAVKAARAYLLSTGEKEVETFPIRSVALQTAMGTKTDGLYFYFITFADQRRPKESDNPWIDVIVLLDGSVLPPTQTTK
jgi:hypothetical protein